MYANYCVIFAEQRIQDQGQRRSEGGTSFQPTYQHLGGARHHQERNVDRVLAKLQQHTWGFEGPTGHPAGTGAGRHNHGMDGGFSPGGPEIGILPHPDHLRVNTIWGGGTLHPAFSSLPYVQAHRKMVTTCSSVFGKQSNLHQQAVGMVVLALLASKSAGGSTQNPRVLAPEGEGGGKSVPLSLQNQQQRNLTWELLHRSRSNSN